VGPTIREGRADALLGLADGRGPPPTRRSIRETEPVRLALIANELESGLALLEVVTDELDYVGGGD
jgi:hypothetical protein